MAAQYGLKVNTAREQRFITVKYGGIDENETQAGEPVKSMGLMNSALDASLKKYNSANKPNILVAEDDLINRNIIKKFFEKNGLRYDIAVDGDEALKLFYKNDYDIIFMDCMMPFKDGSMSCLKRLLRRPWQIIILY
jgi:PleD family two-component response regulator